MQLTSAEDRHNFILPGLRTIYDWSVVEREGKEKGEGQSFHRFHHKLELRLGKKQKKPKHHQPNNFHRKTFPSWGCRRS